MAIAHVGQSEGVGTSISTPAGLSEDDIVVYLGGEQAAAGTVATPTGYTSVGFESTDPTIRVAYKRMGATPDSTISGLTSNSNENAHYASAFSGVDTTTAESAATVVANTESGGIDPPSITPADNDCMIVCGGGTPGQIEGTVGAPTNYTLSGDGQEDSAGSGTVVIAYRLLSGGAASAENPGAFSGSDNKNSAFTMALKPAVAAGGAVFAGTGLLHGLLDNPRRLVA